MSLFAYAEHPAPNLMYFFLGLAKRLVSDGAKNFACEEHIALVLKKGGVPAVIIRRRHCRSEGLFLHAV